MFDVYCLVLTSTGVFSLYLEKKNQNETTDDYTMVNLHNYMYMRSLEKIYELLRVSLKQRSLCFYVSYPSYRRRNLSCQFIVSFNLFRSCVNDTFLFPFQVPSYIVQESVPTSQVYFERFFVDCKTHVPFLVRNFLNSNSLSYCFSFKRKSFYLHTSQLYGTFSSFEDEGLQFILQVDFKITGFIR